MAHERSAEASTLTGLLDEQVRAGPHRLAVSDPLGDLTYAGLGCAVQQCAAYLRAVPVAPGDAVGVVLPNCPEFVVTFLATASVGAVFFPLNPALKALEVRRYVREASVRAIVTDRDHEDLARVAVAGLDMPVAVLGSDTRPLASPEPVASLAAFASPGEGESAQPGSGDAPFLIQFSSGSTGRLKQVRRSQRNLVEEARNFTTTVGVRPDDRILCLVPLHHAHGLGNGLLAALKAGATLVLDRLDGAAPDDSRCDHLLRLVQEQRISIFPGVPYLFEALAQFPRADAYDLSSVRLCFSAGTALPYAVFDGFLNRFGVPIRQLYGCTEAGSIAMNLEPDPRATWDSVGLPLGSVELKIVSDAGDAVGAGVAGQILVRSPALCDGYLDRPEANATAFRDGYFVTGDLGVRDEAGRLSISGRARRFIDTGGYKVDPGEVEAVLNGHPNVAEAVVVGLGVPGQTELVKAAVVPNGACEPADLLAHCRLHLAGYKVPAVIELVSAIPRSPLGKILRGALIDGTALTVATLEEQARLILADLTGLPPDAIERERSLMEYGLDSAGAVQLALRLRQVVAGPVPITLIWSYPTLASILEALTPDGTPSADAPARGRTPRNAG